MAQKVPSPQPITERYKHLPVPGSEIVGSAKLRKREHENKTVGNWGEKEPKSRAHIFACLSFTRHPYYLRALNRLHRYYYRVEGAKDCYVPGFSCTSHNSQTIETFSEKEPTFNHLF